MDRFTAPSDYDYYGYLEGRTRTGLERSCSICGEPVLVTRDEAYQVRVCCEQCQQAPAQPARTEGAA